MIDNKWTEELSKYESNVAKEWQEYQHRANSEWQRIQQEWNNIKPYNPEVNHE